MTKTRHQMASTVRHLLE